MNKPTLQTLHTFWSLVMWSGVLIAALGVFAVMPFYPLLGLATLCAALPASLVGGWFKKKYCPRCRGESCDISTAANRSSNSNDK